MSRFLVYLAGPITGLSYKGATDWRDVASEMFSAISGERIECLSPLRGKDYLMGETNLAALGYDNTLLSSQRGITARDRFDCTRADGVLVNMVGADRASLGTVMEIAWADLCRKPIVLAMEREGNVHEHAMIREACPFRVDTLELAIATMCKVLCP